MSKKFFFFFFLILIILGNIFKIDKIIVISVTTFSNTIKSTYNSFLNESLQSKDQYINQIENIYKLQKNVQKNNTYELLYKISKGRLTNLESMHSLKNTELNATFVEVLSYDNINDFSKLILDTKIKNDNSIKALATSDGFSAGIVVQEENKVLAYLNNNEKCNYAVYIGENNAPGITSGSNEKNEIIIKHIPIWYDISIGDEIITSGMDDIFPLGLKVGKVNMIKKNDNTKTVYAQVYSKALSNKYFYIINKK